MQIAVLENKFLVLFVIIFGTLSFPVDRTCAALLRLFFTLRDALGLVVLTIPSR